jgi:hypothetical protein
MPIATIQSSSRSAGFGPRLPRFEGASGLSLDAGEKAIAAERPTDALGGAEAIEQLRLPLVVQRPAAPYWRF